jgi:tetratricopeptide (TPR) repeat protein
MDGILASVQLTECYVLAGNLDAAQEALDSALGGMKKTSPKWLFGRARAVTAAGAVAGFRGDLAAMRLCMREAADLFKRRGGAYEEAADVQAALGHLDLDEGKPEAALQHFIVGALLECNDKTVVNYALCLNGLADALFAAGDAATALSLTTAILPHLRFLRRTGEIARAFMRLGSLLLAAGDRDGASNYFVRARDLYGDLSQVAGQWCCEQLLASVSDV